MPRGGVRQGAGRPPGSKNKVKKEGKTDLAVGKMVTLKMSEWEELKNQSCDGSPTAEAARIVRKTLNQGKTEQDPLIP